MYATEIQSSKGKLIGGSEIGVSCTVHRFLLTLAYLYRKVVGMEADELASLNSCSILYT